MCGPVPRVGGVGSLMECGGGAPGAGGFVMAWVSRIFCGVSCGGGGGGACWGWHEGLTKGAPHSA